MFKHPGSKLQALAAVSFAIILIAFIVIGFSIGYGIVFTALGFLVGWLASITMYAFGTLVNDVEKIKKKLYNEAPEDSLIHKN
ncbi:MAG: hypothetical protein ACI3W7_09200 [Oscillospiraceae bacterium]